MIFASPLWCIAVILAIVPWVGPWRGSNAVQNAIRSLLFIALAFALAGPQIATENDATTRVVILDHSESVDVNRNAIDARLRALANDRETSAAHLIIAGSPADDLAGSFKAFDRVEWIEPNATIGDSPLSAALARAKSIIPVGDGGSVTLVSDGLTTRQDDDRAVAGLVQKKIPIHVVDSPSIDRPPAPVGVHWPKPLRKGSTSRLEVRVVASRSGPTGTVTLRREGETIATGAYTGGKSETVVLEFEPKETGFLDVEVSVNIAEQDFQSMPVVLPIHQPYRLLYLGDLQKGGDEKIASMLRNGFEIESVSPADGDAFPETLSQFDLVLLDDLPAESLPKEMEQQLVDEVQSGGLGLVMSGGRASFGAGGWHNRPIESLLPIELVQKEEKRDPSTSLVVVIDTSGSMSGVRVQLAKEVARLAMRRLLPHDKVGIVEFYGAKRWAAPLQPASNSIELQRALNRMDAGGGTVILPALEEAFYGLQNVDTRYKHVLVLTDGGVESGDFESLMRRMANEGINVSTVLAGGGYHSEFLVNIANWGKGRFYNVPNRFNLPEILLKQPSTTKLPSYRPGEHSVRARGGAGWWGDVDTAAIPQLLGYVESKPRQGGEVLLETTKEKHPILTTWRYGLGRVTTFATEPTGNGTRSWQEWPDYSKALMRVLERSAADSRDPFRFQVQHDGGEMIVQAIRQRPRSGATTNSRPVARFVDGSSVDEPKRLTFIARSPNHFEARLLAPKLGDSIRLETSSDTTPLRWQPLIVASPVVPEHRVDPTVAINLRRLADVAGGEVLALDSDWSQASMSKPSGETLFSIAPWLFGVSLLLFLSEIIWRRIPERQGTLS